MSNSMQWHRHEDGKWHRKHYSPEEELRIMQTRKEATENFRKDVNFGVSLTDEQA